MSPQAIQELLRLAPPTALLLTTNEEGRILSEEEVPIALVQHGDLLKAGVAILCHHCMQLCCACCCRTLHAGTSCMRGAPQFAT